MLFWQHFDCLSLNCLDFYFRKISNRFNLRLGILNRFASFSFLHLSFGKIINWFHLWFWILSSLDLDFRRIFHCFYLGFWMLSNIILHFHRVFSWLNFGLLAINLFDCRFWIFNLFHLLLYIFNFFYLWMCAIFSLIFLTLLNPNFINFLLFL